MGDPLGRQGAKSLRGASPLNPLLKVAPLPFRFMLGTTNAKSSIPARSCFFGGILKFFEKCNCTHLSSYDLWAYFPKNGVVIHSDLNDCIMVERQLDLSL